MCVALLCVAWRCLHSSHRASARDPEMEVCSSLSRLLDRSPRASFSSSLEPPWGLSGYASKESTKGIKEPTGVCQERWSDGCQSMESENDCGESEKRMRLLLLCFFTARQMPTIGRTGTATAATAAPTGTALIATTVLRATSCVLARTVQDGQHEPQTENLLS